MFIIVLKGLRSFVIPTNKQINKNAWSIVVASNLQTRLQSFVLEWLGSNWINKDVPLHGKIKFARWIAKCEILD